MAERLYAVAALAAGLCVLLAVLQGGAPSTVSQAARWLDRRPRGGPARLPRSRLPWLPAGIAGWLRVRLQRAGWGETPDRFAALAIVVAAAFAVAAGSAGALVDGRAAVALGLLGALAGAGMALRMLGAAAAARRRRLLAELAPTLELTCLELGAGSSAAGALDAVTRRTDGELARELRLVLASAALGTAEPLDARLRQLGETLDLPALTSVAAVIATSRDYGSGVISGLRALAADLRRAQRRELIATSRSALTRVLVPAAVGVLMPFMAILLYPAVTSLAANLR